MEISNRAKAFREWLGHATAGHHYVYFQGNMMTARGEWRSVNDDLIFFPNTEINSLADTVYEAHLAHRVYLFQRKLHDNEYQYIAMKRYMPAPLWMPDGALEIIDG